MSDIMDTFNSRLTDIVEASRQDEDKVLFALGMLIKRAEDNDMLASRIHDAYLGGHLQRELSDLIEIELIEDASQSVIMGMTK